MSTKRGKGQFLTTIEDVHGVEYEITVRFSGYSDSGRLYGPPEHCYPPEGEMEIEIDGMPDADFGDLDALEERIKDEAYEHLDDSVAWRGR